MRVISGNNKGKKLFTPKNMDIRPTTDRIKESIFNIIYPIKTNSVVLDLFSGTGNIGIEFLSRGCKSCYFIDSSLKSIELIKKNINICKLEKKSYVYKNDFSKAITILSNKELKFDYIYADPPYNKYLGQNVLDTIIKNQIVTKDGMLIIESEINEKIYVKEYNNMLEYEERKYGRTKIGFFKFLKE